MAPPDGQGRSREYLLSPGSYMYVQDGTSGKVKTFVGPYQVTLTGSDSPMTYELVKGKGGEFKAVDSLERAVCKNVVAPEGHYVVVMNPAVGKDGKVTHPSEGAVGASTPDLAIGYKVVLRGPCMFPLWPGQTARVIRGHSLRSNQYVLCRVYNQEQAQKNWGDVLLVKVATQPTADSSTENTAGPAVSSAIHDAALEALAADDTASEMTADQLVVGKLFIIRGTQASFYVPPTGITVVADDKGEYVREAISLEQLEYCVLLDEGGTKRFVRGPAVVFPKPTETFMRDDKKDVKFKAIELNDIQGIQIKVTRAHHDEVLGDLREGEEKFITGKQYPIYYPREEHALIRYDGKAKHFAVAVTEGTGRYVMGRLTGMVNLRRGPTMLLPDPTTEVIVRRVLSLSECQNWYPNNQRALEYNLQLAEMATNVPTTRSGVISEGDYERGSRNKSMRSVAGSAKSLMESSTVSSSNMASIGDEISRGSTYNAPRSLVLNVDFEGAPRISPWTGYAVMVVDSSGDRRVVVGPENILLEYDETLEILSLSTGKPKNTDKLYRTPYLRMENNMVSDVITVETSDNVVVIIKVSYLVNFTGDNKAKWFAVENYTKFLCDRMRSKLKAAVRERSIEDFYASSTPIVREVVLGEDAQGTLFSENAMHLAEVEVLDVVIQDTEVAHLIRNTQKETVQRNIRLAAQRRSVEAIIVEQGLNVDAAEAVAHAENSMKELEQEKLAAVLALNLAQLDALISKLKKDKEAKLANEDVLNEVSQSAIVRDRAERTSRAELSRIEQAVQIDGQIQKLQAEADALVKKLGSFSGGFTEALLALSSQDALVKITQAGSVQKFIGGENAVDVLRQMFQGTGLAKVLEGLSTRSGLMPTSTPPSTLLPTPNR